MTLIESVYRFIYTYYNGDPASVYTLGMIGGIVAYFLQNSIFLLIDYFDTECLKPYKIQDGDKPSREKFWNAVGLCSFNILIVTPLCAPFFYYLGKYTGVTYAPEEMPNFSKFVIQMAICALIAEFCFFYTHLALHHRSIYKYFHKIHHEWSNPISITSVYMHPVEHFFGNMIPELLGATLIGAHVTVVFFFAYYILWRATVNHSGYHFPFLSTPESHDYHHKMFNECYSQMGFLDALHGSDTTWNESVEKQRNLSSFSLVPMRIRFPDKKKDG